MREGQIALIRFPQTDLTVGKLRLVLLLRRLPGNYKDWLICMISSQLHQHVEELDEMVTTDDSDFATTGLKVTSVIRVSRLAVVDESIFLGAIGEMGEERLNSIKSKLAQWLTR